MNYKLGFYILLISHIFLLLLKGAEYVEDRYMQTYIERDFYKRELQCMRNKYEDARDTSVNCY